MSKNLAILLISCSILAGCARAPREHEGEAYNETEAVLTDSQVSFLQNLKSLCGKSFRGEQVYIMEGRESWEHKDFLMHVTVCRHDSILVPFHLDEDRSRTWMFIVEQDGLRFRHDHRDEDGTPHDDTLYGGYADDDRGTSLKQYFPADDYTCENFPRSCNATWTVELSADLSLFTYRLYSSEDELIFQAAFDIENPL